MLEGTGEDGIDQYLAMQAMLEMGRAVRLAGSTHGASAGVQCGTARLARVRDTVGGHCT